MGVSPRFCGDAADANVNARAWGNFNNGGNSKGNNNILDTFVFAKNASTTSLEVEAENGNLDSDNDGLSDFDEVCNLGTDPNDSDSDDDGLSDGQEDSDGDGNFDNGETDPNNSDADGGGLSDGEEVEARNDPLSPVPI